MTPRAIGCAALALVAFLAAGLLALSMAMPETAGCPAALRYGPETFTPDGEPTESPAIPGVADPLRIGSTLIGLATRDVYAAEPVPSGSSEVPPMIALDCADGTFQAYRSDVDR